MVPGISRPLDQKRTNMNLGGLSLAGLPGGVPEFGPDHDTPDLMPKKDAPKPVCKEDCGEADCVLLVGKKETECYCVANLRKPIDGKCPGQIGVIGQPASACKEDCGEATCVKDDNEPPRCLCVFSLKQPVNGTCSETAEPADYSDGGDPEPVPHETIVNIVESHKNETGKPMALVGTDLHHLNQTVLILEILMPLIGLLIIAMVVLLIMKKRKVGLFKPRDKSNNASWLHRNDNSMLLDSMSLVNKNPTYYSPHPEVVITKFHVKEIPSEKLALLEEIGEGAFGQVFKGELQQDSSPSRLVAVKLLKNGVSREIKEDFEREVEITSTFDHDNILKLIGVVTKDVNDSPYMVFEFMEHGDLAGMLRKNDPVMRRNKDKLILKDTDLVDVAIQVANGMVYLTQQHFVHRDLATRNCLVGDALIVKISDFGMSRDIYTCDYYKIGGSRMLPVRWMSPESVKYGKFTTESDVWAYGVVLWEIFSYGKQPYYGHGNEEVVMFIENHTLLNRPEVCPEDIYKIMLQCWITDPNERASFVDIHRALIDYSKRVVRNFHKVRADVCPSSSYVVQL
ncbi:BDNF/NT-3 growth factors receptor-like isoform X2 [Lineus longissimus]|uniref:BDNF/NT-3 growth factors receptor-like isoform X2 n=1 Tax=Lineus longissimus TaxID=88925 RepID=UPI00315C6318